MNSWTMRLIAANVVMYFLTSASPGLLNLLMLVPAFVPAAPWTVVTYMFLHANLWHLLFNMLSLFFFGPRLEHELGGRDFLLLYFISGIAGALLSFLTPYVAIVGASGAVFGVLLGFARYWPREQIMIWGIIPVEARWLVIIMTVLSLIGGFGGGGDIAHFAHLGGFAGGLLFLLWRDRNTRAARFKASVMPPPIRPADLERWSRIDRARLHEVNREELDRIMAKLQTGGSAGLTPDERAFLDRFSG
ncbi:MAG: Peptidase rhomboid domain protein [Bacteroidetes bacterium]|nr:Peptidase rhomboid domain protein [Bacteroidota bacterium]